MFRIWLKLNNGEELRADTDDYRAALHCFTEWKAEYDGIEFLVVRTDRGQTLDYYHPKKVG